MEIRNLNKAYGKQSVVHDVSFKIPKGSVISLIGPNGAGKSTVLNIISRLLQRDSGDVIFKDKDIKDWKNKDLAKKLAILTQSNAVQMKLTIEELVTFGRFPYCGNHPQKEDVEKVNEAIAYMELEAYRHRFLDELSGGQRQRAYIAMIIAQDSEYVILDEPTNNLDIYHATNMMKMVRRLCDELGKTIIMVLHDINYASYYSDYICAFAHGEIIKFGRVDEVITVDILHQIYGVTFEIVEIQGKKVSVYFG